MLYFVLLGVNILYFTSFYMFLINVMCWVLSTSQDFDTLMSISLLEVTFSTKQNCGFKGIEAEEQFGVVLIELHNICSLLIHCERKFILPQALNIKYFMKSSPMPMKT